MKHWICVNISQQHDTVESFNLWVSWIIFPAWSVLYIFTCGCWWISATRLIIDILLFLFCLIVAFFFLCWTKHTYVCCHPQYKPAGFGVIHCSHSLWSANTLSGHNQLPDIIWVPEHLAERPAAFVRVLHWCRANSYPPPGE